MASLFSWLGHAAQNVEHAIGGVVHGAEQDVSNFFHPQPNQQQQQNTVNNINQAIGGSPIQRAPLPPPPPPIPAFTTAPNIPVVNRINAAIGGNPIQQAQAQPTIPQHYVNPLTAIGQGVAQGINQHIVQPDLHALTAVDTNVAKPFNQALTNVVKGSTVDLPITVGRAANQVMNSGQQQQDVNAAIATANQQEDQAWRDFRAGKINPQRAQALINDAGKQRQAAVGNFQNQIAQAPSAKDTAMALGTMGLMAAGPSIAAATKVGGATGTAAKLAESGIGGGFAANSVAQLPSEIHNINQLHGPAKTQAILEATANTAVGGLGAAALAHGGIGAARDITSSPLVKNEVGGIKLPGGEPVKPTVNDGHGPLDTGLSSDQLAKNLGVDPASQKALQADPIPSATSRGNSDALARANARLGTTQQAIDAPKIATATSKANPLNGKVTVPTVAEGNTTGAVLARDTARRTVLDSAQNVLDTGKNLSKNDKQLLDLVKTTPTEEILAKAEDPNRLGKTITAMKTYNDTTQALGRHLGQDVSYRNNYGARQFFDIPHEDVQAEARAAYTGDGAPYGIPRKYTDYQQAFDQSGLNRLHSNLLQDVAHDASIRAHTLSERALQRGLEQAHPGKVVNLAETNLPRGWKQLNIPGGGNLATTKELAAKINKRQSLSPPTLIGRGYDKLTKIGKTAAVGGNPFHGLTEAFRFTGQQILSPAAWRHPLQTAAGHAKVVGGTFSETAAKAAKASYEADGTTQWSRIGGQTLDRKSLVADAGNKMFDRAGKLNPISAIHRAVFGREIPLQKQEIMRQAMGGSTDYTNPALVAKARQVALATNHMFGGLDHATDALSPRAAKILARTTFSGDYTEAKARLWQDSLTKKGPQGNIARQAIIGKALVAAAPGILAYSAAGKIDWSNPKDVAQKVAQQILDPNLPTSFKTPSGIPKIAHLPATDISELARILEPLWTGDPNKLSGLEHWAVGRINPVLGPGLKLATNQDYKGDPIIQQNVDAQGNPTGVNLLKTLENLGSGSLTSIGTNLTKVAQGKQSLAEAGYNMAGLRTAADPNDPKMQAFNFQQNTVNGLDPKTKALWNQIHGGLKDANGNPVQQVPALHTQANALALINATDAQRQKILDAGAKVNANNDKLGLPSDPFYRLSKDQQMLVLNTQADTFRNPAEKKALTDAAQSWLPQYYQDRTNFFNSLNLSKSAQTQELAGPTVSAHVQSLFNISDPKARSKALATDPEAKAYFAAHDQYINQGRALQGEPAIKTYPDSTPYIESQLTAKNYKDPQVQDYLNKVAEFNVTQGGAQAQFQGTQLSQSALKGVQNLGNYGLVKNPDGTLAIAGSGNAQSGATSTSRYASGAKKAKVAKIPKIPKFAVAKAAKFSQPKGVKVKAVAFKPYKPKKIAVSKMPKIA